MAQILGTSPSIPISAFADRPLNLAPDDYPNSTWTAQTQAYNTWWSYYNGYVLNQKNDKNQELFPAKLNIVRSSCINHAAVLIGAFDHDKILDFSIKTSLGTTEQVSEQTTTAINRLWAINDGDSLFIRNALMAQIFGGAFYKSAWHPIRRKWPVRFFVADPRACFPVWDGDDYNRLVSIDVYHQVPRPTAAVRYRVNLFSSTYQVTAEAMPVDYVTVHEHWDENEYFIKVDEQIGRWPDGSEMQGSNPFIDPVLGYAIVPYVYAPRIRDAEFYGHSTVPDLIGPQNELNNNMAHLSEGLADAMHQQPWVKNRPRGTDGLDRPRNEFVDLGMTQMQNKDPEVGRLDGAEINQSMIDLVTDDTLRIARETNSMPDITYGKAERTIQSALTMRFMMWPAINVGNHYRKHHSAALKHLFYHSLVMAYSKRKMGSDLNGVSSLGIDAVTPDMIEAVLLSYKTNFPPMLPDDRAEKVNEVVQRITAGIISPERSITMLDGEDGLEEEINRIDEHRKAVAEIESQMMQAQQQARFGQQGQPSDRTTRAQAQGGRSSGNR